MMAMTTTTGDGGRKMWLGGGDSEDKEKMR